MIKSLLKRFKREPNQKAVSRANGEPVVCDNVADALDCFRKWERLIELEPQKPANGHESEKFPCTSFGDVRTKFKAAQAASSGGKGGKVLAFRIIHGD